MKRYKLSHPCWWLLLLLLSFLLLLLLLFWCVLASKLLLPLASPSRLAQHLEQVNLSAICNGFGSVVIKGHPNTLRPGHFGTLIRFCVSHL